LRRRAACFHLRDRVARAAKAGFATALDKTGLSAGRRNDELRRAAPLAPGFVLDAL
jgi:hypothetical protein